MAASSSPSRAARASAVAWVAGALVALLYPIPFERSGQVYYETVGFLVLLNAMLGIGWNFLYVGATTLFTEAYRPEEKTTAQAAMDFCVYTTMALTSFGSGALITTQGWSWLNIGALLPVVAIAAALVWLRGYRRSTGLAAASP